MMALSFVLSHNEENLHVAMTVGGSVLGQLAFRPYISKDFLTHLDTTIGKRSADLTLIWVALILNAELWHDAASFGFFTRVAMILEISCTSVRPSAGHTVKLLSSFQI